MNPSLAMRGRKCLPLAFLLMLSTAVACAIGTAPSLHAEQEASIRILDEQQVSPDATLSYEALANRNQRAIEMPLFDSENRLRLQREVVPAYLPDACDGPTDRFIDGLPSNWTLMLEPRVDFQRCLPDSSYPLGREVLVGLSPQGDIQWKQPLTLPAVPTEADAATIIDYRNYQHPIGWSAAGIIIQSFMTESISILDPETGRLLYPTSDAQPMSWPYSSDPAVFDADSGVVYVAWNDSSNEAASRLHAVDLRTGEQKLIAEIPKRLVPSALDAGWSLLHGAGMWETLLGIISRPLIAVPARIAQIAITDDASHVVLLLEGGWTGFVIYNLATRRRVFEKGVQGYQGYGECRIVIGRNGHIGFQHSRDNVVILDLYVITPTPRSERASRERRS